MADLFNRPISIKFKTGNEVNINASGTLSAAASGEPHYCIDTGYLYVFDGTENVLVKGTTTPTFDSVIMNPTASGVFQNISTESITASGNITATGDITCDTLNYTTLYPAISTPTLDSVLTAGDTSASNDITLTAGTLTSSSLVVDTTTLVANVAGYTDKVGIGTASPTTKLEVTGVTTLNGNVVPGASGSYEVGSDLVAFASGHFGTLRADTLVAGGGWSGTYTTGDARTATVVDGIITDVS